MSIKEHVTDFLTGLARVISAVQMYGAEHPAIAKGVGELAPSLRALIGAAPTLQIGQQDGSLRFAGQRVKLPGTEGLLTALEERGIRSVRLNRGLTGKELIGLVGLLGRPVDQVMEAGQIRVELLDPLPHVEIEAVEAGLLRGGALAPTAVATMTPEQVAARAPSKQLSAAPPLPEGYRMLGPLGTGSQGAIFKVRNQSADRMEACKTLTATDAAKRKQFVKEIRAQGKLSHDSIGRIFYVDNEFRYYLMEYLAGGTLRKKISGKRRAHPATLASWMMRILEGVGLAHERGVIHRDIKPENILFDEHDSPKLCDFGIATEQHDAGRSIVGTPHYMAPEQWGNQSAVDGRADIWAIGVILFEGLTGKKPFDGDNVAAIGAQVGFEPPAGVDETHLSNLTRKLLPVVLRALEKDPANRYQTAGEFAAALGAHVDASAIQTAARAQSRDVPAVMLMKRQSSWPYAAVLLVFLALVGYFVFGGSDIPEKLAALRETADNRKLSLQERIEACTAFLSDNPGVNDDQRTEVERLRGKLEQDKRAVDEGVARFQEVRKQAREAVAADAPDHAKGLVDAFTSSPHGKNPLVKEKVRRQLASLVRLIREKKNFMVAEANRRQREFEEGGSEFRKLIDEHHNHVKARIVLDRLRKEFHDKQAELADLETWAAKRQADLLQRREGAFRAAVRTRAWSQAEREIDRIALLAPAPEKLVAYRKELSEARLKAQKPVDTGPKEPQGPFVATILTSDGFTARGFLAEESDEGYVLQLAHLKLAFPKERVTRIYKRQTETEVVQSAPDDSRHVSDEFGYALKKDISGWRFRSSRTVPKIDALFERRRSGAEIQVRVERPGDRPVSQENLSEWVRAVNARLSQAYRMKTTGAEMAWAGGMAAYVMRYERFAPGDDDAEHYLVERTLIAAPKVHVEIVALVPVSNSAHVDELLATTKDLRESFALVEADVDKALASASFRRGQEAAELMFQAEVKRARGDHRGAAKALEDAEELFKRYAELPHERAKTLMEVGDLEEASRAARKAYTLEKSNVDYRRHYGAVLAKLGDQLIDQGKYERGLEEHEDAYKLVRRVDKGAKLTYAQAMHRVALALLNKGQDKAAAYALAAIKLVPRTEFKNTVAECYYREANDYYSRRVYGSAKGKAKDALKYNRDHVGARGLLERLKARGY